MVVVVAATLLAALVGTSPAQAADRRVSGLVTFSDGAPATGVDVLFYGADGEVDVKTKTGADGRYSLRIPEGTYRLGFLIPGPEYYSPPAAQGYWPTGVTLAEAEEFTVSTARTDLGGVILRSGTIRGNVSNADGAKIKSARVTIYRISTDGTPRWFSDAYTQGGGGYERVVPPGRYVVRFDRSGYATEYSVDAPTFQQAQVLEVGESVAVSAGAQLIPDGTLEGQLFAPNGLGASKLKLTAYRQGPLGWEELPVEFYENQEWYRVKGLSTGPHRICWETLVEEGRRTRGGLDTFPDQCIGGTTLETARDLQAVGGQVTYVPKANLRESMVVSGQVTGPDGEPLPGVDVCPTVEPEECRPGVTGFRGDTTDAEGRYSLTAPSDADTLKLSFEPPALRGLLTTFNGGGTSEAEAPSIPSIQNTTVTQDVQVAADAQDDVRVQGAIMRRSGQTLQQGSVSVRRLGAEPASLGTTDAQDGTYDLALPPGEYAITYAAAGFRSKTTTVTVTADLEKDVVLTEDTTKGTLTGVLTRDGAPLAGAVVSSTFEKKRLEAVTSAQGTFTMRGLTRAAVYFDDELTQRSYAVGSASLAPGEVRALAPFEVPSFVKAVVRPTIAAVPAVDQPVSVTAAQWNTDVTLTYGWYAGSDRVASTLSYTPKVADAGKPLRLVVTARKGKTEVSTTTLARVVKQ